MRKILLFIFILFSNTSFAQSDGIQIDPLATNKLGPFAVVPIESSKLTTKDIAEIIDDESNKATFRRNVLIYGDRYSDATIVYRQNNIWFSFRLDYDPNSVRYEFTDVDSDRVDELVIYGDRADYGTGGGTTETGVTIYKIDTAVTRLFDLVYSFSEESFGRSGPGYVHTCERKVTVGYNQISISPITTTKHKRKGGMEYEDICGSIDDIKSGIYTWQNGRLAWKANYRK